MPGESAAISASTRTRAPTCVNLTLPWACDPLAGRTTAVADGPAGGGVVAHDARNSAQAASFNPLFMLHSPEKLVVTGAMGESESRVADAPRWRSAANADR